MIKLFVETHCRVCRISLIRANLSLRVPAKQSHNSLLIREIDSSKTPHDDNHLKHYYINAAVSAIRLYKVIKQCIEAFMKLALMTYTQVEDYLKAKDSVIIPMGSVEQHSPVGLMGTDHLIAEEIAYQVAENVDAIACPTLAYGMSNHHLAFPGTISINPTTLIAVLKDIITSLVRHGFKKFYFINGHGGNIGTCEAAFSELTRSHDISCKIKSWWMDSDINQYIKELFGDRDGHHATPSEISQTIYFYKKAFDLPIRDFKIDRSKHHWPLSPEGFKKQFPDGRMESDPSLATYDLGKKLFEKSVEVIQKDFLDFESL